MKRPVVLLALALSLVVCAPAASSAREQSLNADLAPIRTKHGLPALAAAVVVKGTIVAAGAVGTRVHGMDIPVTTEDRFHLGSDTKAMTATLAGMMVEEGKLRWDSTIGEVLGADIPNLDPAFAAIRLDRLLSHSSGIPSDNEDIFKLYFSTDIYDYPLPEFRKRLIGEWGSKHAPKVPEGSPFQYSNLGYVTVGAMIEKVAGEPWDSLIQRRIFKPLGLKSAGLGPQATFGLYDAPIGHQVEKGKITPMPWGPGADGPAAIGPAGIAHMSIRDFARWAAWNAA